MARKTGRRIERRGQGRPKKNKSVPFYDPKDHTISIQKEGCTLCGICTTVCPSGALNVHGFNDIDLWERLKDIIKEKEYVVFTCSSGNGPKTLRLKEGSSLVVFPCIGILKDVHLIGLFLSGVKRVWLRSSCKDCASTKGKKVVLQTVEYVRGLIMALDLDGEVVISKDLPEEGKGRKVAPEVILPSPHYSRRQFSPSLRARWRPCFRIRLRKSGRIVVHQRETSLREGGSSLRC